MRKSHKSHMMSSSPAGHSFDPITSCCRGDRSAPPFFPDRESFRTDGPTKRGSQGLEHRGLRAQDEGPWMLNGMDGRGPDESRVLCYLHLMGVQCTLLSLHR